MHSDERALPRTAHDCVNTPSVRLERLPTTRFFRLHLQRERKTSSQPAALLVAARCFATELAQWTIAASICRGPV